MLQPGSETIGHTFNHQFPPAHFQLIDAKLAERSGELRGPTYTLSFKIWKQFETDQP